MRSDHAEAYGWYVAVPKLLGGECQGFHHASGLDEAGLAEDRLVL